MRDRIDERFQRLDYLHLTLSAIVNENSIRFHMIQEMMYKFINEHEEYQHNPYTDAILWLSTAGEECLELWGGVLDGGSMPKREYDESNIKFTIREARENIRETKEKLFKKYSAE